MALISSPSSSSCSNTCQLNFKHDVFISFRGEDTRYNFTGHLHKALLDKQIQTYFDEKLNSGDEIYPSLLKAIEESKISVIIFSKHYASSRWCLQELVKILECKKSCGQTVIPVFYNVVPTDVRNQTGTYGDAFTKHNQQQSSDQVQRWKDALKEAANLSGLNSSTIKDESVLIKNIVEDILKRLNDMSASDAKGLVGIDKRIEQIVSLLGREDVRSVGIWGMGGIGKTTLAEAVFNRIYSQFEGFYFIPNIREESKLNGGLNHMRRELLSTVLEDGNVNIGIAIARHTFTRNRLGHKKLLIVFDDVTNFQQIETLIGGFDCLNSQSRIIITTRDRQVLRNCRVNQVYEVQGLFHHEALELFHRYAFKENHVSEDYMELSKRVCEYTGGVPLALKVLGSFLCNKRKQEWVSKLSKLERIANKDIQKVLKISYDGLDDEEQKIFLDIACFFNGKNKDFVINILNALGFSAEIGISVLSDKSLISLSNDNIITIHDLLQAMAKEIVRQECTVQLSKQSRLWNYDDIYHVLTKDKGTEMIKAISLDTFSSNVRDINLTPTTFAKMEKLRLLKFYIPNVRDNRGNKVHVPDEGIEFVFNELKYLHWYGFPLKSLHPNFQLENLVILEMPNSNIEELWSGFKQLDNLKRIDLTGSRRLIRCPDLTRTPNLKSLNMCKCASLTSIPNCTGLKSLEELMLCNCSKLKRLPELPNNLETLGLSGCTSLVEIPSSFKYLNKEQSLDLCGCQSLTSILDLRGLKSLKELILCDCSKLKRLPKLPNNLETLGLSGCKSLVEIPPSFKYLNKVQSLDLCGCQSLTSILDLRGLKSLKELILRDCSKLKRLPKLPNNLETLGLSGCKSLVEIPPSFKYLNKLQSLDLCGCQSLMSILDLRGLKSLKYLGVLWCLMLPKVPNSIEILVLIDTTSFEDLDGLDSLYLNNSSMLKSLPSSICKLKSLCLFDCSKIDKLPDDIGTLESLKSIDAGGTAIREILPSISYLKRLDSLNFSGCKGENAVGLMILPPNLLGLDNLRELCLSDCGITELSDNLGCLTSLETLCLIRNYFQSIPGTIINLSKLRFLDISYCERIKVLPKLRYWTSISAVNCTSLEELSCHSFRNNSFDGGIVVANFANCFQLNRNSFNNFLEGTVLEMQGRATSIVKRHRQVYGGELHTASICYPENDIPEWFSFRSPESFIDVKLPQHCFNYNFICLALSVVVTISDPDHQCDHQGDYNDKYLNVNYEGVVTSEDGDQCCDRIKVFMGFSGALLWT